MSCYPSLKATNFRGFRIFFYDSSFSRAPSRPKSQRPGREIPQNCPSEIDRSDYSHWPQGWDVSILPECRIESGRGMVPSLTSFRSSQGVILLGLFVWDTLSLPPRLDVLKLNKARRSRTNWEIDTKIIKYLDVSSFILQSSLRFTQGHTKTKARRKRFSWSASAPDGTIAQVVLGWILFAAGT